MERLLYAGVLLTLLVIAGCAGGYTPLEGHQCLAGSENQENCGAHPGAK